MRNGKPLKGGRAAVGFVGVNWKKEETRDNEIYRAAKLEAREGTGNRRETSKNPALGCFA